MSDANDAEVQNALNPNPSDLDENDPNVARDPVCGTLVDKRSAQNTMSAPVNDKGVGTLYFDSAECKALFEDNPAKYGYPSL
jgi:YHS domain-containing protein